MKLFVIFGSMPLLVWWLGPGDGLTAWLIGMSIYAVARRSFNHFFPSASAADHEEEKQAQIQASQAPAEAPLWQRALVATGIMTSIPADDDGSDQGRWPRLVTTVHTEAISDMRSRVEKLEESFQSLDGDIRALEFDSLTRHPPDEGSTKLLIARIEAIEDALAGDGPVVTRVTRPSAPPMDGVGTRITTDNNATDNNTDNNDMTVSRYIKITQLLLKGMSQRDIATEVGASLGTVNLISKAIKGSRLDDDSDTTTNSVLVG
jgi:hypothetical protein